MRKSIVTSLIVFFAFTCFSQLQHKGNVYAAQAGSSVVSNSGDYLYLSHLNALSVYKVNQATGMLTRVQKITTNFGGEVSSPYLSADNRYLYAGLGLKQNGKTMSTLVMYEVNPSTGKMTFKKNFKNEAQFHYNFTAHFSLSPKGNLMFWGKDDSQSLEVYKIDPKSGLPSFLNSFSTDITQCFSRFTMSEDQRNIYLSGGNTNKDLVVFAFNEHTGEINKIQEIDLNSRFSPSMQNLVSADGKNVYIVDGRGDQKIQQYSRNPQTGMVEYNRSYEFKSNGSPIESHLIFSDRNTDFIYGLHAFGDGDAIHVMKRDHRTGNLSYSESIYDRGKTNRLNGVFQMSFSKDNRYVYASGMWDGALNIFKNPNSRKTEIYSPSFEESPEVAYHPERPQDNSSIQLERPIAPTPSVSSCTGNEITGKELNRYYADLAAEESDISRLSRSFELLEGKCMKVVQVAALAYLFQSEYQRLQFVKFTSYFLHDPENKLILADLFQYENMRAEVAQL